MRKQYYKLIDLNDKTIILLSRGMWNTRWSYYKSTRILMSEYSPYLTGKTMRLVGDDYEVIPISEDDELVQKYFLEIL